MTDTNIAEIKPEQGQLRRTDNRTPEEKAASDASQAAYHEEWLKKKEIREAAEAEARKTELSEAIEEGVSLNMASDHFPEIRRTALGHIRASGQVVTRRNMQCLLDRYSLTLSYDMMTSRWVIEGNGISTEYHIQDQALRVIVDTLQLCEFKFSEGHVPRLLAEMAYAQRYHPMEDWIQSKPWDKRDRLKALEASVPTDSDMWPIYLRKWLIQAVEAVCGWEGEPRSLPHVLTFRGGQGAGKGRWLRALAPTGFVLADAELHLNSTGGKDQQIEAFKYPIVELGEIETTFNKSEQGALKGMLSRQEDRIRLPYGKKADVRPRMTVFAGSVNRRDFLHDMTGSRRFWPVELRRGEKLNWDHGIDMQQVFAQVEELWQKGEDWNLDERQDAMRLEESRRFQSIPPEIDMIESHFDTFRDDYSHYALGNKSEIAMLIGAGVRNRHMGSLTAWLEDNLGPARKLHGRKRVWAFPVGTGGWHSVGNMTKLDAGEAKKYALTYRR